MRMVGQLMAVLDNLQGSVGKRFYPVPDAKEGRTRIVLAQNCQNLRGIAWVWTVINSQPYFFLHWAEPSNDFTKDSRVWNISGDRRYRVNNDHHGQKDRRPSRQRPNRDRHRQSRGQIKSETIAGEKCSQTSRSLGPKAGFRTGPGMPTK